MALILFFVSGFAGLIYQVIWTRELALAFGSTAQSASTTVAAFLCGLGIGARLADPMLARGWPPGRLFAGLETLVAVFSLGLTAGLPQVVKLGGPLADLLGYGTPAFVVARFGLVFLLLLPACMAMGATLPILTEYSESRGKNFSASLSTLYAVNTLGAALGALAADFVLIRPLGVFGTSALASALDAGVGLLGFYTLDRTVRPRLSAPTTAAPIRHLWVIFVTGYCALSLEILWVRSLVFFNSSDVYAFSIVVSTYLFGLVLGSWLSRPLGRRLSIAALLSLVSLGVLLSLVCLLWVKQVRFWFPGHNLSFARLLTAIYLMLPVTLLLGAIFPLQCEQLKNCGEAGAVGKAYLFNTLGSLLGSLSAGFLLLPRLGLQKSFLWVAGWALVAALSANRRQGLAWVGALLLAATPWWLPPAALARSLFGRDHPNIIYYQDDHYGAVALIRQWNAYSWSYDCNLIVDGFNMMSNNLLAKRYAATLSALPLLLHDQPERTLVVAFGLANSTSVAVGMNRGRFVDCVELSPTVVKASSHLEHVQKTLANPKLQIIFGDGRNYLATTHQRYDVITAEPPPPRLAGIVNLYTREYFEHCRRCLKPGGMVSHWLPVQEMSPFEARTVIRACQEVFPNTYLWQGSGQHLILLACQRPLLINFEQFQQRWLENQPLLQQYGLDSAYQMLVDCLRMPDELRAYVAQTPALSDNNPYLQHFQGQEMPDYNFFLTAPGRIAVTGIRPNDPDWARAVRGNQLVSQILLQPYPDAETARFENWPRLLQLKQNLPDSLFVQQITRTSPEAMQAMKKVWTKNPAAAMDLFGAYFSLGQRDLARKTMSPQWPARSLSKAQALLEQP